MLRQTKLLLLLALVLLTVSLPNTGATNMTGMLGAAFRDYRDGTSTVDYTLYTIDGAKVPLIIPDDVIAAAGGFFALQNSPVEVVLGLPTRGGTMTAAAIHPASVARWFEAEVKPAGTIPWTFFLCTFSNVSTVPISAADMQTMTGNTGFGLGAYWSQTSHGITTTDIAVTDWADIGQKRKHYTRLPALYAVDAYLTDCPAAHGVTLTGSFNVAIAMNDQMFGQDFALGLYGFDGPTVQRAVFLPDWAVSNHSIIAHEMGHTYGLPHSDNYDWDPDPYDNPWDVMSDSFWAYSQAPYGNIGTPTNALFYDQIGMLPEARKFSFATYGTSATITIDDWMVADSPNYQTAFIYLPNSTNSLDYVVEVHKGTAGGFNSGYRPLGVPTDAVIIYKLYPDSERPPVKLVGGFSNKKSYNMNSAWTVGEMFEDPTSGIRISVLASTENGFSIMLRYGKFDKITTVSPAHLDTEHDPNVTFEWIDVPGVAVYTVKIEHRHSPQSVTFQVPSGCGDNCTLAPNFAAIGWKWKMGYEDDYRWLVSGDNSAGKRVAQSQSAVFFVRPFETPITVTQPEYSAVLPSPVVHFTFTGDIDFEQYRAVLVHGTGQSKRVLKTPWTDRSAICVDTLCTMDVDLKAFPGGAKNGRYVYRLVGRNALMNGTVRSSKRSFTLDK